MGLSSAIANAVTGLRATQAGMDVVSQNVANSGTAGYTRRVLNTTELYAGNQGAGVRVVGAQRVLDTLVQRQLRLENSGASYTGVKAEFHAALDGLFDAPGSATGLPTLLSAVATSLSALQTNPSSYTTRAGVVSAAGNLAGSLNDLTGQVQGLRQNAEDAIGQSVNQANDLLKQIASVSDRMRQSPDATASPALQDQRDSLIDQLSELVDVKVDAGSAGDVRISTTGGLQLFDGNNARTLTFDARVAIGPESTYDRDPAKRTVGTITATDASGRQVDVLATGGIRSGKIAAYVELRDQVLPEAQTQLDALAGGLASALSDQPVAGVAATSGAQTGFDLDLSQLAAGNPVTVSVRQGDTTRTVTFVKATNAAGAAAASASGDGVIGLDFSGGLGSVATQVGAALGAGFTASNPSGSTLRILDDGAAGTTDVKSASARATVTGLTTGSPALPLFTDGGSLYTGSYQAGSQLTGFAGRIGVNAAVKADPATLVQYAAGVDAGDTKRPTFLNAALRTSVSGFSGRAGIAGSSNRFTGTVSDFATQFITTQATNANAATSLNDGQKVVLNSVQSRMSAQSGVNVDTEMSQLIQLQTAYGANARVMSAAKEMLDMLLRVGL